MNFNLWGTPRAITQRMQERKISWVELFSDLVFVVIIHSLVTELAANFSLSGFASFTLVFLFIFNSWNNSVLFFDLHGRQNLRMVVFAILQIITISFVALFIPNFFEHDFKLFALAYFVNQALWLYLWGSTIRFDPAHKLTVMPYVTAYSLGELLLIAVFFITQPTWQLTLLIVALGLFLEILLLEQGRFNQEFKQRKIPFALSSALLERYGLFTMIILGESLAGLIEKISEHQTSYHYLLFLSLMLGVVGMWYVYYSLMDDLQVSGTAYWQLSVFRGFHAAFILVLTLQAFFLDQLATSHLDIMRAGFVASIVAALWLLIVMINYDHQPEQVKNSWALGIASLLIMFTLLLPTLAMILVVSLLLIAVGLHKEILKSRISAHD
ncbi:hypothetical protein C5Z26_06515 [Lactobacillus sp. CBA3606]|uniref:low temperature requirement protein A n=1 Tax=Lactobacillus sp. CBA3606 TaxID=2099789 RepID=UPI000CFBDB0C|nr:low temperature requirement protein A [Lactobacillus sp. CBA3606]AVK63780.1 hypothetical protein C5Z26_06515 [Lactobacillus sp. CBA3606]